MTNTHFLRVILTSKAQNTKESINTKECLAITSANDSFSIQFPKEQGVA